MTGLFKEAVPITHQLTLAKIHLNFRLTYLKDVVMARYIDDGSFNTIRELILLNNIDIISHIQSDKAFLLHLFQVCVCA
jgi:protein phosphatase-4 regulatory subunit 3